MSALKQKKRSGNKRYIAESKNQYSAQEVEIRNLSLSLRDGETKNERTKRTLSTSAVCSS